MYSVLIYIRSTHALPFKIEVGYYYFFFIYMFWKEASYAHKGCIYLIYSKKYYYCEILL